EGERVSTVKDGDLATPMELRDFLGQVGTTMRLPPRTTVSMTAVAEARLARPVRAPVLLPLAALLLMVVWAAADLRPTALDEVPSALLGTWVTDDPRYAGRTVEFGPGVMTVRFPGGREASIVRRVSLTQRGDTLAVVLQHGDEAQPQELSLGYVAAPEEHIVLSNPVAVHWFRRQVGGT
ncbi:MAG: hypothetical protein JNL26_07505, partial [Gemmatimonadetes bacterium]|nr:hypothetical protein [Gemmatimonadota bacterium]